MDKIFRHLFVVFIVPGLMARVTLATTSNWIGPGSDFNTSTNWDSGVATDVAGFNSATPTSISFSVDNTTLNTLMFNSGAAAYTLTIPNAIFVTIAGQGVVNNSTAVQTIINNGGSAHGIAFTASASAGNAVITNNLGNLDFEGNSTAGNATITNNEAGLVFQDNSTAGNAKIVNQAGGAIDFYDNSTAGHASITNEASVVFEDNATANNAAIINYGTMSIQNLTGSALTLGSLAGSGYFLLGSNTGWNTLAVGSNGQSTVFSGVIDDSGFLPGSLIKVGTGTLTLSGGNSYSGGTTVAAGTLNVTGSLTGNTLVQTGATLSGTGTVGSVSNGGTVTPGVSSAGKLTASSYSGSGTLNIPFNEATHSSLAVTGNANLTGGALSITGTNIASGRYDILTAGSLTGTFATVTTSPNFFQFQTQYTPTDVEVIINSLYYSSLAQTQNQRNVAWVLDASGANENSNFIPVANALSNLSASQTQSAINELSGDALASFYDVGLQNAAAFTHQMLDHGSADNSMATAALAMPVQLAEASDVGNLGGVNSGKPQDFNGIWARGIGLFETTSGDSSLGSPGSTANTGGFQVGYDYTLTDAIQLGVSGGYAQTNLAVDDRSSSGNTTADEGGVYARFTPGPWFFDAAVGYSANSNDNSRIISFPGIDEQANASFNSHVITGFAEAGYDYKPQASYSLEPSVSIRESHLEQDGYTETGAPGLDLTVADQSLDSVVSSVGARLSRVFFQSTGHAFTLGARTAWEHELGDADNTISAQFADAPGASFTVQGTPRPRNSADLGIDGSETISKNLQAFVDYSATLGSGENIQAILGGLRLTW